jgi:serine/threonine-protein kinase ULK/ATG1
MPTPLNTRRTTTSNNARAGAEEDEVPRPYVIVSHIGKGSFATVYKGYHEVCLVVSNSLFRY